MNTIQSNDGTPIAYASSGAGPPLVLVHGTAADHTRWKPLLPALEAQRTVYAMDRRGRGDSGDQASYDMEREFEDIAAVVDSIGQAMGQPVDLLGHSHGAICSLEAALRTAQLRRLILYEPPIATQDVEVYAPAVLAELEALIAAGQPETVVTTFMSQVARIAPEAVASMMADASWPGRVASAHTIPREIRAVTRQYQFSAGRFASLETPVLLLLGGASPRLFRAAIELLQASLPNNRVVELAGQQHVAMNTAPEMFVAAVLGFLEG